MEVEDESEHLAVFESHQIKLNVYEPLKIVISHCYGSKCIILWNKFCLLLYENDEFSTKPTQHHFDTTVDQVNSVNNLLLYRDTANGLYFTILRREEANEKKLIEKVRFKKVLDNVHYFLIDNNQIYVYRQHFLYIYNLTGVSTFKLSKKIAVESIPSGVNFKIYIKHLQMFSKEFIKSVLSIETIDFNQQVLFFINEDKIYTCILKSNETNRLALLHTCPVSIAEVGFGEKSDSAIYLALSTGSVTILKSNVKLNTIRIDTVHLNCTIEKIIFVSDRITYTDGRKLWQTSIDCRNMNEIKATSKLLKIVNSYDFVFDEKYHFYCSTLNHSIYIYKGISSDCFVDISNYDQDGHILVPKTLGETRMVFDDLLKESKKNEIVLSELEKENALITIAALRRHSKLLSHHLVPQVQLFDDMNDLEFSTNKISLICDLGNYYKNDVCIYLITYDVGKDFKSKLKQFLNLHAGIWMLNVQMKSEDCSVNTSLDIIDENQIKFAIPMKTNTISMKLDVKLISLIPSICSNDVNIWCSLPSETILINSKYHFKTGKKVPFKIYNNIQMDINERIYKISQNHTSTIYDIIKLDQEKNFMFTHYIRLPNNFKDYVDEFCEIFMLHLNNVTKKNMFNMLRECFFNKKPAILNILNEIVGLDLIREGNIKKLKLSGADGKICWNTYCCIRDDVKSLTRLKTPSDCTVPYFDFIKLQKIRETIEAILLDNCEKNVIFKLANDISRDFVGIIPPI